MTAARPCVGIIIPAWNAASTIARAVRSALVQAEVAEVIVVDDCSADATATAAILRENLPPRWKATAIVHEEPRYLFP